MNYSQQVLLAEDIAPDDEIDNLFSQLQVIEPPPSLVENILASVALLSQQPLPAPTNVWEAFKELIVHNECQEPS